MRKICAVYITREADNAALNRSLSSVLPYVDAAHVCLTKGKKIVVEQYVSGPTPTFSEFPWNDSFGDAKTAAIDNAKARLGEDDHEWWWLIVDSDDVLRGGEHLHSALDSADRKYDALALQVGSEHPDGSFDVVWQARLLSNELRFRRRIHEFPWNPTRGVNAEIPTTAVHETWLVHEGYVEGLGEERVARNRALLDRALEEDPHDFMLAMQYARQEMHLQPPFAARMAEQAILEWQRDGHYLGRPALGAMLYATKLNSMVVNNRFDDAIDFFEHVPFERVSAEMLYIAGVAYANLGRIEQADRCWKRARNDTDILRDIGGDTEVWTWKPLEALAEMYTMLAAAEGQHGGGWTWGGESDH